MDLGIYVLHVMYLEINILNVRYLDIYLLGMMFLEIVVFLTYLLVLVNLMYCNGSCKCKFLCFF